VYLTIIKDGQTIDHRTMDIECLSFEKDSVEQLHEYETTDSGDGLIPLSTKFGGRRLRAIFYVEKNNHLAYELVKNEINRLFTTKTEMAIIDSRQPDRKWNVKVANTFAFDRVNQQSGQFFVEFLSSSAYAEAVTTPLQSKVTTTFTIVNGGDKEIDPRKDTLIILYRGASTNLKITNNTTGDIWQYTGGSVEGNTIKLEGIRSFKNSTSIFRNTNRKVIRLAPGSNSFTLTGTSGSFIISFEFQNKYI
jgi:phage-related protein